MFRYDIIINSSQNFDLTPHLASLGLSGLLLFFFFVLKSLKSQLKTACNLHRALLYTIFVLLQLTCHPAPSISHLKVNNALPRNLPFFLDADKTRIVKIIYRGLKAPKEPTVPTAGWNAKCEDEILKKMANLIT